MDETIPVVDVSGPGVPATVVLDDGTHVHGRFQPGFLVNGGVLFTVRAVEQVHSHDGDVALHQVLGVDPRHLQPDHSVWIPGHRVRSVILGGASRSPRPIGFQP